MQVPKQEKDQASTSQELEERKSDATSDETLSDVEEKESESDSANPNRDPGPSPDGSFDEPSEIKDAGPM